MKYGVMVVFRFLNLQLTRELNLKREMREIKKVKRTYLGNIAKLFFILGKLR